MFCRVESSLILAWSNMAGYLLLQNSIFWAFLLSFNDSCNCFETLLWKIYISGFKSKPLYIRKKEIRQGTPFGNSSFQSYLSLVSYMSLSCANSLIYAGILRDFAKHAVGNCSLYLPYHKESFGNRELEV